VTQELKKARLLFAIGKGNVLATFEEGLNKSRCSCGALTDDIFLKDVIC